jgi:hypothetical protein
MRLGSLISWKLTAGFRTARDCPERIFARCFHCSGMETPAVLFVGSVFLGLLATMPFVRLQQLFKRLGHPAPLDGNERAEDS